MLVLQTCASAIAVTFIVSMAVLVRLTTTFVVAFNVFMAVLVLLITRGWLRMRIVVAFVRMCMLVVFSCLGVRMRVIVIMVGAYSCLRTYIPLAPSLWL
jgi:hypothetical protein